MRRRARQFSFLISGGPSSFTRRMARRVICETRRLPVLAGARNTRARQQEARSALALLGVDPSQIVELGFVDQEAIFNLPELAEKLAETLTQVSAKIVFTHPYEGGHPDHDATAFAVHAAQRLLRRRRLPAPEMWEFTS